MLIGGEKCIFPRQGSEKVIELIGPGHSFGEADLTISAGAHDFLLLARRQEDPDKLLVIEGDTELGPLFKNTLDAIDVSAFDLGKMAAHRVLAPLLPKHGSRGHSSQGDAAYIPQTGSLFI